MKISRNDTLDPISAARAALDFLRDGEETASVADAPEPEPNGETKFYGGVLDALKAVAPVGSTVNAVGFDGVDMFLRAGYRAVDGEADVVLARGGEREFALARKLVCRKLVLFPTHAFTAAATDAYRATDGAFAFMKRGKKPNAAVFDESGLDRNLASIFGELVSLDLDAFDMTFGAQMRGERIDTELIADVAALVSETTDALRPLAKNRAECAKILTDAGRRAARIVEREPRLMHASGAAQTAEALRMLYSAEDRQLGMRGETEFLLGGAVLDFYIKKLGESDAAFPPDNNKRIDRMCEYFSTDIRRACVYVSAVYPPLKMRLYEYRRTEFRAEQTAMLAAVRKRRNAAEPVFKRLYPDDGYGLKTLVDKTDLPVCIALAPDVFAADTLLSFFKQTGKLEKYLA